MKPTFLRVDLLSDEEIDTGDDQVGEDVQSADGHEDLRIIEGYLFRHLHHTQDDHQIGTAE